MAVTPNQNDVLQIKAVSYTDSQVSVNVRQVRVASVLGTGLDLQALVGEIDNYLDGAYKAVISVGARWRGTSIQRISPGTPSIAYYSTANDGPGLVAGDPLPSQVSGLISLRSDLAGRANRGRLYVGFPSEGDSGPDGNPTQDYVTRLQVIADFFDKVTVMGIAGNGFDLQNVIWHRASQTTTNIEKGTAQAEWATQRRRGAYGQRNRSPF